MPQIKIICIAGYVKLVSPNNFSLFRSFVLTPIVFSLACISSVDKEEKSTGFSLLKENFSSWKSLPGFADMEAFSNDLIVFRFLFEEISTILDTCSQILHF